MAKKPKREPKAPVSREEFRRLFEAAVVQNGSGPIESTDTFTVFLTQEMMRAAASWLYEDIWGA